ncbi:hypothetical protein AAFM46_03815 [Arthrobacter sp. TMP15]|uniref:hypothetical protein n=1 Tax=Arthrobacter sp. TMP15 TaxID=3140789 RepID=UPI0031BAFA64
MTADDAGSLAAVGSAQFQEDARLAHKNPPILRAHSKYGQRIDEVDCHPFYHRIISQAVAAGAHTPVWEFPGKEASALRAAQFMLFAQVKRGSGCLGCAGQHHPRRASGGSFPPDRPQVVLFGAYVGCVSGVSAGRGGAWLLSGAQSTAGCEQEHVLDPAPEGQAGQQIQRFRRA